MTKKPKQPLETRPIERLVHEGHEYEVDPGTGQCKVCRLPEANRLHSPENRRRERTDEQRRAEMARLGERED